MFLYSRLILSSSIWPHQRKQLLFFCFSPSEVAVFSSSRCPQAVSQLPAVASILHCGTCPAQVLYQREGEIGEMSMRLICGSWIPRLSCEGVRIINACGFTWEFTSQTLNRYPGRVRVNRSVHYSAKYVYVFLGDGKNHTPWHRITALPNIPASNHSDTKIFSENSMVGFLLTIQVWANFFFSFTKFGEMADSFLLKVPQTCPWGRHQG